MKITDLVRFPVRKINARKIGLPLVYLGVVALIVCVLTGYTKNILLILPALFIIAGVVLHVFALKHESKY